MSGDRYQFELQDIQKDFIEEVSFMLESADEAFLQLNNPSDLKSSLTTIFRVVHSIKGAAAAVGFEDVGAFAHCVEDLLQVLRVGPNLISHEMVVTLLESVGLFKTRFSHFARGENPPWNTAETVTKLKNLTDLAFQALSSEDAAATAAAPGLKPVAQLPVSAEEDRPLRIEAFRVARVIAIADQLMKMKESFANDPRLKLALAEIDQTICKLRDEAHGLRMTSLQPTFKKIQRVAQDLSIRLGKPLSIASSGETVELDRNLADMIADSLLHLVRNAVDHGIESQQVRLQRGKSSAAAIVLSASIVDHQIAITLRDDGGGINRVKVLAKARKQGIVTDARRDQDISDQEVFGFLFASGFSTAETVTDVSGRGVGLDVVRSNIEKMNGTIVIESTEGVGTVFKLLFRVVSNADIQTTKAA